MITRLKAPDDEPAPPMDPKVAAIFPPDHWSEFEKAAYLVGRDHGLRIARWIVLHARADKEGSEPE